MKVSEEQLRMLAEKVGVEYNANWKPHRKPCHAFPLMKMVGAVHGWAIGLEYIGALEGRRFWVCQGQPMGSIAPRHVRCESEFAEEAIFKATFRMMLPDELLLES